MFQRAAIRHSGSLRLKWHCRNVRHSYHRILQNAVVRILQNAVVRISPRIFNFCVIEVCEDLRDM